MGYWQPKAKELSTSQRTIRVRCVSIRRSYESNRQSIPIAKVHSLARLITEATNSQAVCHGFFMPENMTNSSIAGLDMSKSNYNTHFSGLGHLSPCFLLSCSELRKLHWASSSLAYFTSCDVPESLRHLKIHYSGLEKSYGHCDIGSSESTIAGNKLSQLETLCKTHTLEAEKTMAGCYKVAQDLFRRNSIEYHITYGTSIKLQGAYHLVRLARALDKGPVEVVPSHSLPFFNHGSQSTT